MIKDKVRVYLGDTLRALLEKAVAESGRSLSDEIRVRLMRTFAKATFKFATDSESGLITAIDFDDACRQLDEMVGSDVGWGWVEDTEGRRYETPLD